MPVLLIPLFIPRRPSSSRNSAAVRRGSTTFRLFVGHQRRAVSLAVASWKALLTGEASLPFHLFRISSSSSSSSSSLIPRPLASACVRLRRANPLKSKSVGASAFGLQSALQGAPKTRRPASNATRDERGIVGLTHLAQIRT